MPPIRALMLDVDGVLVVHPHPQGWSVRMEQDIGLSPTLLQSAFFAPHWDDIIHGRASLRVRLAPVLAEIAPGLSCEKLVAYWFAQDAHVQPSLLDDVARLRASGLPVHLATVQEHERAKYLWETVGLNRHFDAIHYAADLGAAKPHPDFYRAIENRTSLPSAVLMLVDDKLANIEAARALGWHGALWTGEDRLVDLIDRACI